jgi:hypothetical protein
LAQARSIDERETTPCTAHFPSEASNAFLDAFSFL